jgi:hypothetical protein
MGGCGGGGGARAVLITYTHRPKDCAIGLIIHAIPKRKVDARVLALAIPNVLRRQAQAVVMSRE